MHDCKIQMPAEETEALLSHLDRAIQVLEGSRGQLSALEIRAKSMLAILRQELFREHARRALDARDLTAAHDASRILS